ncbi:hypothetical protein M378DRAFT_163813 [Amanita muscaria Koide BX008]|uniref:Uncharacterized protein n=1 Tax=Amanita muscaria (strain Koide BX008) TaxID=946122 RepID=A0A0C2SKX9_AMAMK|nr:hypothetical protein M378DRAFT_163813 [Amanita muscaria Koide BX008]
MPRLIPEQLEDRDIAADLLVYHFLRIRQGPFSPSMFLDQLNGAPDFVAVYFAA